MINYFILNSYNTTIIINQFAYIITKYFEVAFQSDPNYVGRYLWLVQKDIKLKVL